MIIFIKTIIQLFPIYYYHNSSYPYITTLVHLESLRVFHVISIFIKKKLLINTYFSKLQEHTPICTLNSFVSNFKCDSLHPKLTADFSEIELIATPYQKIYPVFRHLLGYYVIFHQRIR